MSDGWRTATVLVVAAAAAVTVSWLARLGIRTTFRYLARRALAGHSTWWHTRQRRAHDVDDETYEQRRRLRIDAAARTVSHLVTVGVWLLAAMVVFHLLDVDAAFYLSSAGFVGAAVAFGGQHKVHDYLSGLAVHFEDRYGVGDRIVAEVGWSTVVEGVVDHVGLFTTRIRDGDVAVHVPNGQLNLIRNRSQRYPGSTVRFRAHVGEDPVDATQVVVDVATDLGLDGVVDLADVRARRTSSAELEFTVRCRQRLEGASVDELARGVRRRFARP